MAGGEEIGGRDRRDPLVDNPRPTRGDEHRGDEHDREPRWPDEWESGVSPAENKGRYSPAGELIGSLNRLLGALDAERRKLQTIDDERRRVEVEKARLEVQVEAERELRRRAEEELRSVRRTLEQRHEEIRRIAAGSERIALEMGARGRVIEPERRVEGAAAAAALRAAVEQFVNELWRHAPAEDRMLAMNEGPDARRRRLQAGLERLRGATAGAGRASGDEPGQPTPERLGAEPASPPRSPPPPPPPEPAPRVEEPEAAIWARRSGKHLMDRDTTARVEEPPLPPGWRYATDSPGRKRRWLARKAASRDE